MKENFINKTFIVGLRQALWRASLDPAPPPWSLPNSHLRGGWLLAVERKVSERK